ncbi:aminotransferase [Clostridium estertheticum]|uniref:aminotransferase n=1 Tax=Clostridium estertheticum TaxID=238834 RepID=UPI001C0E8901|nr:aminotransferase [Clostridium estertheticum]MBU3174917.1 aminotransferase [Clostridium estertheticum]
MKIKNFKVEQWMNDYEEDAKYNIAETCVYSITLNELFELSGEDSKKYWEEMRNMRLTYGHINGSPELKKGIRKLYRNIKDENILTTHGAIGANHMVLSTLVESTDRVVAVLPTYQQHYSIPESIGADVQILRLKPEDNFLPNLSELRLLVNENTKIICINNPNNPSGSLMSEDMLQEIIDIARSVDAYILCDEVYRGLNQEDIYVKSIADMYEKGISTSSMSKVFSLAGLRLGWIAGSREVIEKFCIHRDYSTISCGMLDEAFAALALNNADKILARNKKIVRENLKILDEWVAKEPHISYIKPQAGTTALLYYDFDIDSRDFCVDLITKMGVLLTPGSCFEFEGCVRIGYASTRNELVEGLEKLSQYIMTLK